MTTNQSLATDILVEDGMSDHQGHHRRHRSQSQMREEETAESVHVLESGHGQDPGRPDRGFP